MKARSLFWSTLGLTAVGVAVAMAQDAPAQQPATANAALPSATQPTRTASANPAPVFVPKVTGIFKDVETLTASGTEPSVVKAYVEAWQTRYSVSAQDVLQLHQAGVPSDILTLLLRHSSELSAQPSAPPMAPVQPNAAPGQPAMQYRNPEAAMPAYGEAPAPSYVQPAAPYYYPTYSPYDYAAPYSYSYSYAYPSFTYWPSFGFYYSWPGYRHYGSFYRPHSYGGYAHYYGGYSHRPFVGGGGFYGAHSGFSGRSPVGHGFAGGRSFPVSHNIGMGGHGFSGHQFSGRGGFRR